MENHVSEKPMSVERFAEGLFTVIGTMKFFRDEDSSESEIFGILRRITGHCIYVLLQNF